jgi:hypothetical protein
MTPRTKYFLDTEFIEDGTTIDLLSIALVAEDGRWFYRQHAGANFLKASDWVWRNVFPHLEHFNMNGSRSCNESTYNSMNDKHTWCGPECHWRSKWEIRDEVVAFLNIEKFGKPEFWGYYADYDWVAFCQLFGSMISLPKGFPMYCRDLKQWCDSLGNPDLPKQGKDEHSALLDAQWNKSTWEFLNGLAAKQTTNQK